MAVNIISPISVASASVDACITVVTSADLERTSPTNHISKPLDIKLYQHGKLQSSQRT